MGVAGSGQDSGSEHQGQSSRDVAGAGNSLGVGDFPRISIGKLHRSPFGGSRLNGYRRCDPDLQKRLVEPDRISKDGPGRCQRTPLRASKFKSSQGYVIRWNSTLQTVCRR